LAEVIDVHGLSYGAELELSDWPRHQPLAPGQGIDVRDVTMVNSNGVAVDPRGLQWNWGGEINTAPSHDVDGQADQLADIMRKWPETTVNYRSNLHCHVRVPQLREDLKSLKRLQTFIHRWMPLLLPIIEPLPRPFDDYKTEEEYRGALRRWRRRKVSHQKLMLSERLRYQLEAESPEDFRDREYRDWRTEALHPAIHPRLCVNLRQLWETDTIEFRHFPGTTSPLELLTAVTWCREFVKMALREGEPKEDPRAVALAYAARLPRFQRYDHWLETGYEATSVKFHPRAELPARIEAWLEQQRQLEGA
jgi:hypothetical protein